ncbi:uncharacterized protein LOC108907334 [Anoplophora glabripennis]|uniref:uncharacterized protein LOC108907334 n=1 Tax=Anoplophora glabripennis TaxID=217634 RepID=UPI000873DEF3|nr:uncharacterized protein LOC108907334 [Anoplophora glabripennis]
MGSIHTVLCKNVGQRDPRFIRGTYTVTVVDTSTVTSVVPSSCVQVDATLPPCRSVRFLYFPKVGQDTNETPINDTQLAPESKSDPIQSTPLGWGEYLGIYAPTVTVVRTELVTTVVTDPRVVLTYSVKGCRPLQLPENLERCSVEDSVSISHVLPTSTVVPSATVPVSIPENSRVINVTEGTSFPVSDINDNQLNNNLESSSGDPEDVNSDRQPRATDPLPF